MWGGWSLSRLFIVLLATGVIGVLSSNKVATDITAIYQPWAKILSTGTFPIGDVTWQYPPLAGVVMLIPDWLPVSYFTGFLLMVVACDVVAMSLLLRGARGGGSRAGAWLWVVALPLLGPTGYCRFDLVATVFAVVALLTMAARPRLGGALAGLGALIKVWPLLTVIGAPRGKRTRDVWLSMIATCLVLSLLFAVSVRGAFSFMTSQAGRGIEAESLGALPFYYLKYLGRWAGDNAMHYGSMEFLGTGVSLVSDTMVALSVLAFCWLLLWRWKSKRWTAATPYDAALAAVLLFVVTSRVISPQYMIWLIGLAAVCLTRAETTQRRAAWLILAAVPVTGLEFPFFFGDALTYHKLGIGLMTLRDLLLLAAALLSCRRLWRATVSG